MNIDITDMKSRELIQILSQYPQGKLEMKFERIFWSSDYITPEVPQNRPGMPQTQQNRRPGINFQAMSDQLGRFL
jgi:hypothetical protein